MTVAIVDYGSGNLHSVKKAFERVARDSGFAREIIVTADPDAVRKAERIVLPGVGAFADCRRGLYARTGIGVPEANGRPMSAENASDQLGHRGQRILRTFVAQSFGPNPRKRRDLG